MNYAAQYFRSAETICNLYDGAQPLGIFLKNYFRQHTKFGSRDRKRIAQLCYCYYRLGHGIADAPFNERAQLGLFLGEPEPGIWAELYDAAWLHNWGRPLTEKITFVQTRTPAFDRNKIFSWVDDLSEGVDPNAFTLSHLVQPDLFLRIRPGGEEKVLAALKAADLPFSKISQSCIAMPNGTKADQVVAIDKDAVVQDYSSQRVAGFFPEGGGGLTVWDCCAASGGKSILIHDTVAQVQLTVTDVRASIIANLQKRLATAGVPVAEAKVHDLAVSFPWPAGKTFDLVMCDAPCSGSGTWSRTPEQLYFFTKQNIDHYTSLEKKIVDHAVKGLGPGSFFLYITCSVFKKENEAMVEYLSGQYKLSIEKAGLLAGAEVRADTMYAALLKKAN